jgi:hypothetical protein
MRPGIRLRAAALLAAAVVATVSVSVGHAAKWDPIDPKELALATPAVEKDADAEVLLWDVRVADELTGGDLRTVWSHHLRIKIFTDRGREAQSRVDIPLAGAARVRDVEGRSIRRDGSFVELKGSDVFERDLVKVGRRKVRATSFVLPAVETGGIVEYRWREFHDDELSQNIRLPFSRDIPVRLVRYHIAPLDVSRLGMEMRATSFHSNPTPIVPEGRSFFMTSVSNVPAYHDEPYAPSEWEVRPWMLIYYDSRLTSTVPGQFWLNYTREVAEGQRSAFAPTSELRRAAASLSLGSASLDQKIAALVDFCRAKIKRLDVDTATEADRKGFKGNKSPTAALASGRGTAGDVGRLFVALARAASLDARLALMPSRDDVAFDPAKMLPQLFREWVIAVRDGDQWRILDPTNVYAPNGHLAWTQELQEALIPDDKSVISERPPASPPEWSLRKRTATLQLSEDGTLEGDVTTEFTGHLGMTLKEQDDHVAPAEREKSLTDLMASRLPGVEMTKVTVENVTEIEKPYTTRYHLKAPGYAQRTGSRVFVQPAVFQKGIVPTFPAATRRYPIYFEHAWKEIDVVQIAIPPGYALESPDAPPPITFGRIGGYSMKLARTPGGDRVEMTREFFFGGDQRLQFPASGYPTLKRFFDEAAKADTHVLTLRKSAGTGGRP